MTKHLRTTMLAALLATGPAVHAAEGEALHEQHCMSCHRSIMNGDPNSIYTRENRMIESHQALEAQVRRCEHSLGLRWFDDQVDAVTAYLNRSFYGF